MSDIFDKAKDLITENRDKAKGLIAEHNDKVDGVLDQVAKVVDDKTGGKHKDKIGKGAAKAKAAIKNFADNDKQ